MNAYGVNGWTPLHMAAGYGDLPALEVLLNAGADPTIKTEIDDYLTPAEEARKLGQHAAAMLPTLLPSA